MIPVSVMVSGQGTVSTKIKGHYDAKKPPQFSGYFKPIVFWNITYQCNLRCAHCYINAVSSQNRRELSTIEAQRVAEELVELEIPLVILSGGEPLVRKDFWDIIEPMAGKSRPKLALSTNGTLITRDVAEKLASYMFTYIGVSLDSIKPEWHDKFRGVKGSFEATIKGIKNSIEAGLEVGIRTTITRYNVDEVPEILRWSYDNGIKRISLYILDTVGRGVNIKDWLPTHDQLRKLVEILVDEARKYAGQLEILLVRAQFLGVYLADKLSRSREEFLDYIKLLDAQGNCGRKSISIYPDGTVKPCQFIDWVTIGDLRREKLRDILSENNQQLKPFLKIEEYLKGPRCSGCPFKRICGGGSRGRALEVYGDPWADEPLCFIDYDGIARRWGIESSLL